MASLIVWMNGELVGEWGTLRTGTPFFKYEKSWAESRRARALSLSLPLTADLEVRGEQVEYYFDNLLPDSPDIRRRIRDRFHLKGSGAFDLLMAIGRDCVGAVQLLPSDQKPTGWDGVDAHALSEKDVERVLASVAAPASARADDDEEEFRISLAGAQEKTALLGMGGKWYRPRGSTPTTHILKLPLGIVGGFRGDFTDSVENEWLCAQFLRELGLPIAETSMARFGEQRALVVTRFDRRWIGTEHASVAKKNFKPTKGVWIARLPQEDLCQATGRPQTLKYERDGGPSIPECLGLLGHGENAEQDRANFVLAQLAFWLLAAIDGHAKNFSIYHRTGGSFGMTPLYDVLSAWPVIGHGKNQLAYEKARLAMALRGKRAHYRLNEIHARHWEALAAGTGIQGLWKQMQSLVERAPDALKRIEGFLPRDFPERIFTIVRDGVDRHVDQIIKESRAA